MTIKFNGEYIPGFDALIQVERQVKILSTLENAGDFSYQFTIPDTAETRRILGIQSIDTLSRVIYTENVTSIESDGVSIYVGELRVEAINDEGIQASFFSGNSNWFNLITDNINQMDLSANKVDVPITNPSAIIPDSWDNTEWITFPLINKGILTNWSTPVLRTNNFMPFVYVKNIFNAVFDYCGLKVTGELLEDGLFSNLIVGTNSQDGQVEFLKERQTFAGKTATQSVGTSPTVITFPIETFPYYDGAKNNWDGSKYTTDIDVWSNAEVLLNLDANVTWTLEILVNGSMVDTKTKTSTQVSYDFQKNADYTARPVITLLEGDELEVSLSISSGTVNVTDGWFRFTIVRLLSVYPQFLLNQMTQREFITGIFTMFNVITTYDVYSKTVNCHLFRNLKGKEEQDLSQYIDSYTVDFIDPLKDYTKRNLFTYQAAEQESIDSYNKQSPVPYGGGIIEPDNRFLQDESEISVPFTNSFYEYSDIFQAYLMTLGLDDISIGDEVIDIVSAVVGSGGVSEFTTATDHGFEQLDYVWITDTSTGDYIGIGIVQGVSSNTEFEVQNLDFTTTVTGSVVKLNVSENISNAVFMAVNIPNLPVPDFSNLPTFEYGGVNYSEIAYAFFLKNVAGKAIDSYIQSPAFQNPLLNGYNNNTLIESNYGINKSIVDNPVKVFSRLVLPENVFRSIDQTRPVRLKTKDFNAQFFCERIGGYTNSSTVCEFELVKL